MPENIVYAEDKRKEIEEKRKLIPPFRAMTNLSTLDDTIEGFRKGQLVVVSGPPKNGKTQICQTFTKHFVDKGIRCLWFSYELSFEEIFEKFPMDKLDFYVPDFMESGNLDWVEKRIKEAVEKYNTEIIFIDNLDFLRDPEILKGVSLNLSSYVGGIVQRVKSIAVKHNIVIFLMSHIRKNKWTTNEVPSSEELRDTGQVAQLADLVMMIIRKRAERGGDEVYAGTEAILGVVENRHNGKTKKIHIALDGKEFVETGFIPPRKTERSDEIDVSKMF